jgi:hypothetical protein
MQLERPAAGRRSRCRDRSRCRACRVSRSGRRAARRRPSGRACSCGHSGPSSSSGSETAGRAPALGPAASLRWLRPEPGEARRSAAANGLIGRSRSNGRCGGRGARAPRHPAPRPGRTETPARVPGARPSTTRRTGLMLHGLSSMAGRRPGDARNTDASQASGMGASVLRAASPVLCRRFDAGAEDLTLRPRLPRFDAPRLSPCAGRIWRKIGAVVEPESRRFDTAGQRRNRHTCRW